MPLVYALLIGKKTADYDQFFETLSLEFDFDPETVLIDFEQATIKSITKFFPDANQQGTHDVHIDTFQQLICVVSRLLISYGSERLATCAVSRSSK